MGNFVETIKKQVKVGLPLVIFGIVSYTVARYSYDRWLVEKLNKSDKAIKPAQPVSEEPV